MRATIRCIYDFSVLSRQEIASLVTAYEFITSITSWIMSAPKNGQALHPSPLHLMQNEGRSGPAYIVC